MPATSIRDIRIQPTFDDLVLATHGRSIWVMDDIRPLQELPSAVAAGAWLFEPRTSYEYNLTTKTEGNYTNYTANNPPYGVPISYYQATPQATAPQVTIRDASGRIVRTLTGSNASGINRVVWNFTAAPPVKWFGAANRYFQGPDDGAMVVPGTYTAHISLNGRNFVKRFSVKADPQATETLAQMRQSYEAFATLNQIYSSVDTMLNHLDLVGKALVGESAQTGSDAADALARAREQHAAVMAALTANYTNSEDSVSRPGALRENLDSALSSLNSFPLQAIVTPAATQFYARIGAEYRNALRAYNAYSASIPTLNRTLTGAGLQPMPALPVEP